jgi:hypothetical protein
MRWLCVFLAASSAAWGAVRVKDSGGEVRVVWEEGGAASLSSPSDSGAPDLPFWSRLLAVPSGHEARLVETGGSETVRVTRESVLPVAARRHCGGPPAARDDVAFERAKTLPLVELGEESYAGPIRVVPLTLRPYRLHEKPGLVRKARKVWATVRFVPVAEPKRSAAAGDYAVYANLTVNKVTGLVARSRPLDLILVHEDFKNETSLLRWIQLKEEQGRDVRIRYFKPSSTSDVQSLIKNEYGGGERPTHTVLVGSLDKIPAFRKGSYWSDFPYTLLDSGNLPDLSLGRLPVRSGAELASFLDKIIARERNPRDDGKVLVTSGYETGWCHKNLAFIQSNIFDKSPIPLTITKLYATEGKKTDAVVGGYNADPNFIVYDGHGDQSSMTEIPLAISHMSRLKNRVFPILFDIACLNSYWPSGGASSQNFAHSLATLTDAGVAGILAASSNSNGHDLFRYMFRAFVYDDKTPASPLHKINEIGSVVLYGKLKYLEENGGGGDALSDSQMFFYHGDPASTLFTAP